MRLLLLIIAVSICAPNTVFAESEKLSLHKKQSAAEILKAVVNSRFNSKPIKFECEYELKVSDGNKVKSSCNVEMDGIRYKIKSDSGCVIFDGTKLLSYFPTMEVRVVLLQGGAKQFQLCILIPV